MHEIDRQWTAGLQVLNVQKKPSGIRQSALERALTLRDVTRPVAAWGSFNLHQLRQEVIVGPSLLVAFVLTVAGRSDCGDIGCHFRECCGVRRSVRLFGASDV